MATALLTILLTFLLTGLVANRLSQAWQYRNWLSQQRLSDVQKELDILKDLFDELMRLGSQRQHKMIRLLAAIRSLDDEKTRERLTDYDAAVMEWNEHLNSLYARITMHMSFQFTKRLEDDIHALFVGTGIKLVGFAQKKLLQQPFESSELPSLERDLNVLQGRLVTFGRDILRYQRDTKRAVLYDTPLTERTLGSVLIRGFPKRGRCDSSFQTTWRHG
jgi:hypothetical protein